MAGDLLAGVWCSRRLRASVFCYRRIPLTFWRIRRVKVISGSLSHQNPGNQIGRASTIFTFIFLAITAVSQIICLNRGLKVYDSTLVVPVFYGVYTGAGFLDSLVRQTRLFLAFNTHHCRRSSTTRLTRTSRGHYSLSSSR